MEDLRLQDAHRELIDANHILHYHGLVDAYGHVSLRHPLDPQKFLMSKYLAPGTVSSADDLVEYWVADANPVDPKAPKGYSERHIHAGCLRAYEHINAVVHSHAEECIPFGITGVPLKPVYHMAAFLGGETPVWDISDHYDDQDEQNMLVNQAKLGQALAAKFQHGTESAGLHAVVLMRGHGMTVVGESLKDAVLRAIYTRKNAAIQMSCIGLCNSTGSQRPIRYLNDREAEAAGVMTKKTADRPWRLWLREVHEASFYRNTV